MKNFYALTCAFACFVFSCILPVNSLVAQCTNADFSNGDFSGGWTGTFDTSLPVCTGTIILGICLGTNCAATNPLLNAGLNQGPNNSLPSETTEEYSHIITTVAGGNDPNITSLGGTLPMVWPGGASQYSMRQGSMWQKVKGNESADGETTTYSFTVTPANCNFTYHYAVVLTDGGHTAGQQPLFTIAMTDGGGNPIPCAAYEVDATTAPTIGGFNYIASATAYWKPWTSVFVPLSAYMGQNVKITFTTRGCIPNGCAGGHYAYAYISAECAPLNQTLISSSPSICGGSNITLTAPSGAGSYAWVGPGIVSGGSSQVVTVNAAGQYIVNMTTLGNTPCDYADTIVIPGSPSNPDANFSADTVCAGTATTFTDHSVPAGSIASWAWDFTNSGTTESTSQSPTYTFATAGTYPVKLTVSETPCTADTTINVVVSSLPTSTFTATGSVCAGQVSTITYTGNGTGVDTYTWNFDGGTVISGTGAGPYQVNWSTAGTKNITLTVAAGTCASAPTTVPVTVTAFPGLTISPSATICPGGNTTITASGATTYSWAPSNTLNSSTNPSVVATPATTTIYTVTGNTSTCTVQAVDTVTVNPIPTSTFTATGPVCPGQNSTITFTGTASGAAVYTWNFAGGTVASGTGAGPYTVNWPNGGLENITLSVTDVGCSSTLTTVPVTVNPSPTSTFTVTSPICIGSNTTITYTGNGAGAATYVWDFAGGTVASGAGQGPYQVNWGATGTENVTLSVTQNGCSSAVTTMPVLVTPIPTSPFTVTSPVCALQNSTITYTGNAPANSTYTWNFGGGTVVTGAGQGPYQVNWPAPGNENVTLSVTEGICATTVTSIPVTVNSSPVSAAGSDTSFCSGDSATIGTVAAAGCSYSWNPTSGLSDPTLANPVADLTNITNSAVSTTYTVTTSQNGCSSTDAVVVTVNPIPTASYTVPAGECLMGNSFNFVAGGSFLPSATVAWNFGANATPPTSTSLTQSVSFSATGTQTVSLTISQNTCVNTFVDSVSVYPEPVAGFMPDSVLGCVNFNVCFTNTSVNTVNATYLWVFGDGSTSTLDAPCHTYSPPGTYTVSLIVTANGCSDSAAVDTIKVIPDPTAIFTESATSVQIPHANVVFLNQSQNAISYLWEFGDSATSTDVSPQYTFTTTGRYNIVLTAYNTLGCTDSTQQLVTVVPPDNFYIPNVFAPTGNGVNDEFYIYAQPGAIVQSFMVFDRWGEKVHDGAFPWDGNYKGKPAPQGVYVYEFELGIVDQTYTTIRKGSVTLLR